MSTKNAMCLRIAVSSGLHDMFKTTKGSNQRVWKGCSYSAHKISVNEQKLAAKVVQRGNEKVSYCVCHLESLAVNSGHRGKSM